ncbi:SPFH domain-containing protein [Desulfobotulus sp.]|uniref:SPFH domain-containing protein n=1 Tax=Desulfobotulus sp. TaxID=1940337 RepID=UPI002A36DBAB|nr:SPFH domain-containing protein [Desulfobotulus sp.]MDY0164266.1 SPFH domain-containing protein [Desulfobotulus sp.]
MEEQPAKVFNGWAMLIFTLMLIPGFVLLFFSPVGIMAFSALLGIPILILMGKGFFTLQPNEARVLILFGKYRGTVKKDGFHWANPFSVHRDSLTGHGQKCRVSLRARSFETETLKVNDLRGNPIEIAAVVVWQVQDTAQALFDVDDYEHYVHMQSESAVRHLASHYPYDHADDGSEEELTLRGNTDKISEALEMELRERLARAGVSVSESRLTHLAYAPEIAGTMLRRQQAEAIISARKKIVHGAVSMVEMALEELSRKNILTLDEERKAAMVGNLLVVLCGETQAEPVINMSGQSLR